MDNLEPDSEVQNNEWQGKSGLWAKRWMSWKLKFQGKHLESHMIMVSPYLSEIKRNHLLAPIRAFLAWYHSMRVVRIESYKARSANELDVLSSGFKKFPGPFRNLELAREMVEYALLNENIYHSKLYPLEIQTYRPPLVPHTRALLNISYGEILISLYGNNENVRKLADPYFQRAISLEKEILSEEDIVQAERQWTRILSAYAFYKVDYPWESKIFCEPLDRGLGRSYLVRALIQAREWSMDQHGKIVTGCKARGITPADLEIESF